MIRGLLYRQLFLAVDAVLVAVCALWVGFFILGHVLAADGIQPGDQFAGDSASHFDFAKTGPPGAYSEILRSGIFGEAAKGKAEAVQREVVKAPAEEISKLPLVLKGTVFAGPLDPLSSATILREDGGQQAKTYFIGNEVLDKVYLQEVRARVVILRNERENKLEHLPMLERYEIAEDAPEAVVPPSGPYRGGPRGPIRNLLIRLNREDIEQKLRGQRNDLLTKVDVTEHKDENGKVIGLTSPNISQIEVARELGFEDNDILTAIDNRPIDSIDAILKVLQDLGDVRSLRVGIIRNGKKRLLNYSLR